MPETMVFRQRLWKEVWPALCMDTIVPVLTVEIFPEKLPCRQINKKKGVIMLNLALQPCIVACLFDWVSMRGALCS